MKNIGIVRRLDELGRIVIPREFRKTHRINVGDPLEIIALENGDIIISKVDHISDLTALCETACSSLSAELSYTIAASSFEKFVICNGQNRQSILEKDLPSSTIKLLKNREFFNGETSSDQLGRFIESGFNYVCIAPILSYDDCFGGIFAFSNSAISGLDAAAIKLAGRLIGETLGKY